MFQLSVLVVALAVIQEGSACLENALTPDQWRTDEVIDEYQITAGTEVDTLILLDPGYYFSCAGTIRQWRIHWHYNNTHPLCYYAHFFFYVLRESDLCSPVSLVDQNTFRVPLDEGIDQAVDSVFDIEPQKRINVSTENFLGVALTFDSGCSNASARIAGKRDSPNVEYHGLFSRIFGIIAAFISPCDTFTRNEMTKPFITAILDDVGSLDIQLSEPNTSKVYSSSGEYLQPSLLIKPAEHSLTESESNILTGNQGNTASLSIKLDHQPTYSLTESLHTSNAHIITPTEIHSPTSNEPEHSPILHTWLVSSAAQSDDCHGNSSKTVRSSDTEQNEADGNSLLIFVGIGSSILFVVVQIVTIVLITILHHRRRRSEGVTLQPTSASQYQSRPCRPPPDPRHLSLTLNKAHCEGISIHLTPKTPEETTSLPCSSNETIPKNPKSDVSPGQFYMMTINEAYGSLPS